MSSTSQMVLALSIEDIEQKMEAYLNKYYPEHLESPNSLDVEKLLEICLEESHDVFTQIDNSLGHDIEAFYSPIENTIHLTDSVHNGATNGVGRSRFTVAHEVAHVILHREQFLDLKLARKRKNQDSYFNNKIYCNSEWQADAAAAALLLPRLTLITRVKELKSKLYSDEGIIMEICEVYEVSKTCAIKRLEKLQLIKKRPVIGRFNNKAKSNRRFH